MPFVIAFLTFVMVITCLFLILLVLVQLPKKDAGAGMAFGGGAADAMFGAGSGNLLTKITGWSAFVLLLLALVLGKLQGTSGTQNASSDFTKQVEQKQQMAIPAQGQQPKPQSAPPANNLLSIPMQAPATNAAAPVPAAPSTTPAK